MAHAEGVAPERRARRWRSVSEKLQIVQLTLEPGASVAEVARAHGVNANQVFSWRRAFERGELVESCALLPVTVSSSGSPANDIRKQAAESHPSSGGSIHIEFPGRAMIGVESGADPKLPRSILESLSK